MICKRGLALLSIVLLELMLIGDLAHPVKAINKRVYLKKLKKWLPLLVLVKPKKKIILVPIPIRFKNSLSQHHVNPPIYNPYAMAHLARPNPHPRSQQQHHQQQPLAQPSSPAYTTMMGESSNERPGLIDIPMEAESAVSMFLQNRPIGELDPFAMMGFLGDSSSTPSTWPNPKTGQRTQSSQISSSLPTNPIPMMLPSMKMTIQSGSGGNSAIELSTNMLGTMMSPSNTTTTTNGVQLEESSSIHKWHKLDRQRQSDPFDDLLVWQRQPGGKEDQRLTTSWKAVTPSPAKAIREERLKVRHEQSSTLAPPTQLDKPGVHQTSLQNNNGTQLPPKNDWRPSLLSNELVIRPEPQQTDLISGDLGFDELTSVAPPTTAQRPLEVLKGQLPPSSMTTPQPPHQVQSSGSMEPKQTRLPLKKLGEIAGPRNGDSSDTGSRSQLLIGPLSEVPPLTSRTNEAKARSSPASPAGQRQGATKSEKRATTTKSKLTSPVVRGKQKLKSMTVAQDDGF